MAYPSIIGLMSKPTFQGNRWDLFYELVRTDFVMRYHNSILGFVWVLLKPFLLFLIIVTVFSFLFRSHDPHYQLNLLLGLLLYNFFAESTLRGITSLTDRSSVILKVNFPKIIAVYTTVANSLISFFSGFVVFVGFLGFSKSMGSELNLPYFFFLVVVFSGLILGINLFTGIIYIKLRDFLSVWEVILQLIFWGTPIVYPLSILPESLQRLALLNPLTVIITQSRAALISGDDFDWRLAAYAAALSSILLVLGFRFFSYQIKKVAENF